jgi:hypothetical protein
VPKARTPPLSLAMNLRFTINTDIPTRLGYHCGILTSEPCATTSEIDIPTRLGYHRDYSRPPPSAPSYPLYLPQNLRSDQWLPGRMRLHSLQLRIYIVSFRAVTLHGNKGCVDIDATSPTLHILLCIFLPSSLFFLLCTQVMYVTSYFALTVTTASTCTWSRNTYALIYMLRSVFL